MCWACDEIDDIQQQIDGLDEGNKLSCDVMFSKGASESEKPVPRGQLKTESSS